jgi:hypothetical protein
VIPLTEKIGKLIDRIRGRKRAYQLTFGSPAGKAVLDDLAPFCRADRGCFDEDPRIEAAWLGRQEVWWHIMRQLHMTSEEIFKLYHQVSRNSGDDDV